MALNKKVASLLEKKRLISKEIEDLQNMCEHKNKTIENTNCINFYKLIIYLPDVSPFSIFG